MSELVELAGQEGQAARRGLAAALDAPARLLMVVSPPGLRAVNRIQGLAAGDRALAAFARRLRRAAPAPLRVCRLAGAKFAVVTEAATEADAIEAVGQIFDALAARPEDLGAPHIGAAWAAAPAGEAAMVSAALSALDAARDEGPQGLELAVIDPAAAADAVTLAREALAAIRAGAASLALQPVVDAGAPTRILFSEALIRLRRPGGEVVAAGRFMPTLTRLGVAAEADLAILDLALDALARDPGARISVNISGDSLRSRAWRGALLDAAARAPETVERLIVEVSEETAAHDVAAASELFALLRGRGVALALDDFGAGRTSFSHLRDFRFDMVKIDGGFVRGVDAAPDNQVLIGALTGIARSFDMMVIAEFVETAQEARALREIGVDGFQGFFFGRPTLVWSEGARVARVPG